MENPIIECQEAEIGDASVLLAEKNPRQLDDQGLDIELIHGGYDAFMRKNGWLPYDGCGTYYLATPEDWARAGFSPQSYVPFEHTRVEFDSTAFLEKLLGPKKDFTNLE